MTTFVPACMLVTGGAGFIGSHVVTRLVKKYPASKVIVLDNLRYCSSMNNLESVLDADNFEFVLGSINSADLVAHILKTKLVDCILHFAAETHVDNSFGNSFAFTTTNILGTHVLLEAAKQCGEQIKRFIHVSTDEVYGESKDSDKFLEKSVLEPTNPYAATKASAELLVKAYHRSFNLPVIISRGNNVYGPNQYPEKVIPKFISQLMRGRRLTIHGTGETRRNLLFIDDVADAFLCLLENAMPGETVNIGGNHEYSVWEIAQKILKTFGLDSEADQHIEFVEDRKFNDTRYNIDCSKLQLLGWKQKIDFDHGLKLTVDFYLKNPNYWGSRVSNSLEAHPVILEL